MERLLVTGASGLVGAHCLPLLAGRYELHLVSSRNRSTEVPDSSWHQVNLLEPLQAQHLIRRVQPHLLLHLAWVTDHGLFWQSPLNHDWVTASLTLFKEFAEQGGRRLVSVGTCAEYDWGYGVCNEQLTPMRPTTIYGKSKYALSLLQSAFASRLPDGAVWARIFHIFGPGENSNRLIPSVILALKAGNVARTTPGTQIRDLLYARDAGNALVRLLESNIQGDINLGSGLPVRLSEVVELIDELIDHRGRIELGALPIPPNDPIVLLPDVQRLRNEVEWKPIYTLRQGLREMISTNHWC